MKRPSFSTLLAGCSLLAVLLAGDPALFRAPEAAETGATAVPILVYHRFGPTASDRMTTPTPLLEAQLQYLLDHGYQVVPLRQVVDHLFRQAPAPPPRAVVITVDDGHRSVYTDLFPLIRKHRFPVTLFIYPSAIANATYALTWDQLREMRDSGLVDIQSHTYWHPNFRTERRRLSPSDYEQLVTMQLLKSRRKLADEVGGTIDLLAWPFGIYDPMLMQRARETGYLAAFTIEPRPVTVRDEPMALPRYLLTDTTRVNGLAAILARGEGGGR